jgi:hypothetical protein
MILPKFMREQVQDTGPPVQLQKAFMPFQNTLARTGRLNITPGFMLNSIPYPIDYCLKWMQQ